ncbi:MAG: helix-hairpin-helix domain-containing protein [Ruminococcus sp.]|nr:helix-hairpin-helix domain-containing protein [Ruminococcus sp.]
MRDNKDNNATKKRIKLSKTDAGMGLLIMLTASAAIISTVFLQRAYKNGKVIPDSAISVSKSIATVSTTAKTAKTTSKQTTKATTKTTTRSTIKTTTKKTTTTRPVANFYVDVNDVTKEQLLMIDGLGDSLVDRIIAYRQSVGVIRDMEELLLVEGIGDAKLETLKLYLYVSDIYRITTTTTTTKPVVIITNTKAKTNAICKVNINTASADEIARCLCISDEIAQGVIEIRNRIGHYSNSLELLYVDGFTKKMHAALKDYILL